MYTGIRLRTPIHRRTLSPTFFAGGWKGRLYTMGGDTEITQSRTNLIVQIQTKNKNSGPH